MPTKSTEKAKAEVKKADTGKTKPRGQKAEPEKPVVRPTRNTNSQKADKGKDTKKTEPVKGKEPSKKPSNSKVDHKALGLAINAVKAVEAMFPSKKPSGKTKTSAPVVAEAR